MISLNDTIDPNSLLHDGVLGFDHHAAVTFTSLTSMDLSGDRAFISCASHKELMGMLKQRWKCITVGRKGETEKKKPNEKIKQKTRTKMKKWKT